MLRLDSLICPAAGMTLIDGSSAEHLAGVFFCVRNITRSHLSARSCLAAFAASCSSWRCCFCAANARILHAAAGHSAQSRTEHNLLLGHSRNRKGHLWSSARSHSACARCMSACACRFLGLHGCAPHASGLSLQPVLLFQACEYCVYGRAVLLILILESPRAPTWSALSAAS
jgi:hypothetical protein